VVAEVPRRLALLADRNVALIGRLRDAVEKQIADRIRREIET